MQRMTLTRSLRRRWRHTSTANKAGLFVVLLAAALIVTFLAWPSATSGGTGITEPLPTLFSPSSAPTVKPLVTTPGERVVVVGDSWSEGVGADVPTDGFMYLVGRSFGWNLAVLPNGPGSGYLSTHKGVGSFSQRIAQQPTDASVQLVIIQGGLNDQGSTEPNTSAYNDTIAATIREAQRIYPSSRVLLIGAVSPDRPASTPMVQTIDDRLAFTAAQLGVPYVNPVSWLPSNALLVQYINSKIAHPNTAGHAYIASRVEAAIRALE